jgi:hypothetical protein
MLLVAVHEAGHLVVARHLGYHHRAAGSIWESIGEFEGKVRLGEDFRSARDDRLVSVAGAVAVSIWFKKELEEEDMSASDWQGTGCEPGKPDAALVVAFAEVAELLRGPLWPDLVISVRPFITAWEREQRFDEWEHSVKMRAMYGDEW